MPRRSRTGYVSVTTDVDIDVCEVLDQVETRTLEEELATRKDRSIGGALAGPAIERDLVVEAHRQLLLGRAAAALALLDRALIPSLPATVGKRLMELPAHVIVHQ